MGGDRFAVFGLEKETLVILVLESELQLGKVEVLIHACNRREGEIKKIEILTVPESGFLSVSLPYSFAFCSNTALKRRNIAWDEK